MPVARDQSATQEVRKLIDELSQLGWYHSITLPDGNVIPGLLTVERLQSRIARFPIPEDLTGKRVLDIGAWDGWFSFEMERRGASVVAVDSTRQTNFLRAKELLNSKVEYHIADVCQLSPRDIGYFDIVLFLGVLYHLKHPILALEKVCELTTDLACVESFVTDDPPVSPIPLMEFYEGSELLGQFDNWVGPNTACLLAFCRAAGFARVDLKGVIEHRAHAACYRKWPEYDQHITIRHALPAPDLIIIENSASHDHNFSVHRDDYISIWFDGPSADLTCDTVFIQVGPFGARPSGVHQEGGLKTLTYCKLPPGLSAGWHDVSVRVADSSWSAPARIPVDLPPEARLSPAGSPSTPASLGSAAASNTVKIAVVADGKTFEQNRVNAGTESCVTAWAEGLPAGTAKRDVSFRLNGTDLPAVFIGQDEKGRRQINAMLPSGLEPGDYFLTLRLRDADTQPVRIQLF